MEEKGSVQPTPRSPIDQRESVDRAARGIGRLTRATAVRTELHRLPTLMREGEVLEVVVSGIHGLGWGILVATNQRVLSVDKGIVTFRVEDIGYDSIKAVNAKTGIVGGEVELRYYETWRLTNFIPNPDVHRIAEAIRERVREAREVLEVRVVGEVAANPRQDGE